MFSPERCILFYFFNLAFGKKMEKNKVRNTVAVAHPRDSDNVRQDIAIYFALNALLVHHVERLGGPEHQNCQSERSLV